MILFQMQAKISDLFRMRVDIVIYRIKMLATDRFKRRIAHTDLFAGTDDIARRIKSQMMRRQTHAARHLACRFHAVQFGTDFD